MEKKIFQIIIFGEAGVGKTTLFENIFLNQLNGKENDNPVPLVKFKHLINPKLQMQLNTCKSLEQSLIEFNELHRRDLFDEIKFQRADAGIFVFDITNRESISDYQVWSKVIEERRYKEGVNIPVILVGTKKDIYKKEGRKKLEIWFDHIDLMKRGCYFLDYFDICALSVNETEEAFRVLLDSLLKEQLYILNAEDSNIKNYYLSHEVTREKILVKIHENDMKVIRALEKSLKKTIIFTNNNLVTNDKFRVKNNRIVTLELSLRKSATIPESIGNLECLTKLILSASFLDTNELRSFTSLPESITNLKNLRSLKINYATFLRKLPKTIGNLSKLEELDLGYNGIEYLPQSITELKNLVILRLNFNSINTLPNGINKLTKLKELDLDGTNINSIPESLMKILLRNDPKLKINDCIINEYITLKLEDQITNIYINNELFLVCKYILLNLPVSKLDDYDKINSIDDVIGQYDFQSVDDIGEPLDITPETEFLAHCSNLQAWVENDYDTRLLHMNLAFPMLKRLTEIGDFTARRVFKDEIALRFLEGNSTVRLYLIEENYLKFLDKSELEVLVSKIDENDEIYQLISDKFFKS